MVSPLISCLGCSQARLFPITPLPEPKTVNLSLQNFCPTDGYQLATTFAHNASSLMGAESWLSDWDRDGLSDEYERSVVTLASFGVFWRLADNNDDGFDDLWMVRNNITLGQNVTNQICDTNGRQDTDLDGLNACTERLMRTASDRFDSDGDLIPDGIEFRFGLNPSDRLDAELDPDDDGLINLREIQANTPIGITNSAIATHLSLKYKTISSLVDNRLCHNVRVENIPVIEAENGNLIQLFVVESKPNQRNPDGTVPRQLRTVDILLLSNVLSKSTVRIDGNRQFAPGFPNSIGTSDLNPVEFEP